MKEKIGMIESKRKIKKLMLVIDKLRNYNKIL